MAYLRSVDMPFLFQLQLTAASLFWLLLCILIGVGYAWLMYRPLVSSNFLNRLLFGLRTIVVTVIAYLLVAPMIRFVGNTKEKPIIILAQDNSSSVALSKKPGFDLSEYNSNISKLAERLAGDFDLKTVNFGSQVVNGLRTSYKSTVTDINTFFKYVNDRYSNRNVGAIILASDGIYNRGGNPEYEAQNIKAPIYSIALGDTIPKKDVLISNVNYNNIVYLDNDFQVEVSIEAFRSRAANTHLTISNGARQILSKPINFTTDDFRITIPLTLSAQKKGIQKYTVKLNPIASETSLLNNVQVFYVEVIDGKSKVLILADSPHPDLAALKQAIEVNKNYQVETILIDDFKLEDLKDAGLLVLHQLPSSGTDLRFVLQQIKIPVWFILGAQSNTTAFSNAQSLLAVSSSGAFEETSAKVAEGFYDFALPGETIDRIQNFAPLISPFGTYMLKGEASVVFNQQIAKVATNRPLLVFSKGAEPKVGVLAGEGLWRWRLEDFKEHGDHQAVDLLVGKTVQYLISKGDKRKFRVYASRNAYDEADHVILNAELYNDNYELVTTPDVSVTLNGPNKRSYPFLFSRTGNTYVLDAGILPPGEYTFTANTTLGKENHTASGQFAVTQQGLESRNLTANHQLLYNLAELNNGEMVFPEDLQKIYDHIKQNELIKTVSYEDRRYEELISLKPIFFLIFLLLTIEWFLRKREGLR